MTIIWRLVVCHPSFCSNNTAPIERVSGPSRNNPVLAIGDMSQGMAHSANSAALAGRFEHAGDFTFLAGMGVADQQFHSVVGSGPSGSARGPTGRLQPPRLMPKPIILQRPLVLTATAISVASETIHPL
ncbi:MAG: hypothetical protein P8N68_14110 [Paracoccaceae bacterium]|nr:hypothetical protein [Paracoccaceae bacterium]